MSAVLEHNSFSPPRAEQAPIVVVGTGPSGSRCVERLVQHAPERPIVVFGDEPWEPYNRVRLAGLLTGEVSFSEIQTPLRLPQPHRVEQRHNCKILRIDRERQQVFDSQGAFQPYSHLVLAMGSHPHIPHIEGTGKPGVYTFRNLEDAQTLLARGVRSRHALVLGGGLLGLEAARGLQKHHTQVTVVEHASRLMARQLDDEAAELLREQLLALGMRISLGDSVKRILGDERVDGVELLSGRRLDCDTLVIATGIRPNIALARAAGIAVGRGIRVNDQMQTSDSRIYAVGECAEHRDQIYGLVAPGLEQAAVAAHHISGGKSTYRGSQAATRLKVMGVKLFSAGRTGEGETLSQLATPSWRSYDSRCYRKLLLHRQRLVGAIACGDWDESARIQESILHARLVWPWQVRRFLRQGRLWPQQDAVAVTDWPDKAVVCQCTGVTRGALGAAQRGGCASAEQLTATTGAGGVCGSCRPLLAQLAGATRPSAERGSRVLMLTALVSLLGAIAVLLAPAIPYPASVQAPVRWDLLWRESLLKQVSGFSLLALAALAATLTLRKRGKRISLGRFSGWRVVHVALGALAVAILIAHTGLRLGHHLNFYLMLCFSALLLSGALAAGAIGMQHRLPATIVSRLRGWSVWLHLLLLWPLPVLLGFHVLKTYWF